MECGCPSDYAEVFPESEARENAARFRRRGLRGISRAVVAQLTDLGIRSSSLLEIGGGLGEIQVVMLESGLADSATNVDLATNWESEALALLKERGLQDRVTRVCGDFVELAPDIVKIDMSLVRDAHQNPVKRHVIRALTEMCKTMGLSVVAEGIENREERDVVVALGCDLLQGFHLGRPNAAFLPPRT